MHNFLASLLRSNFLGGSLGVVLLFVAATGIVVQAKGGRMSPADEAVIDQAVAEAASRIQRLAATDPGALAAVLQEAFGARLNAHAERELLEKAARLELPLPRRILFVPSKVLPAGAAGAYAAEDGGVVFINVDFRGDASALADLILHEWGHHLDAALGSGDAPGEEGEIFLLGVNNSGPVPAALQRRIAASGGDHATIAFEGRTISVEMFFHKKIANAFKKAANWVGGAVKTAVNTVGTVVKDTVNAAKDAAVNAGKFVGNTVAGAVQGVAGGLAHLSGNSELGNALLKGAGDSFKGAAKDALETAAAAGNLYNKTAATLNKAVPHLGTALQIGAAFTPLGPYLAVAKGIADVKNACEKCGTGSCAGAIGFAALDIGGSVLGRTTKGIKAAKVATAGERAAHKAAMAAFKLRNPNIAALSKPGLWGGTIKPALTKADDWFTRNLISKTPIVKNLDKYKYTKATAGELRRGHKILDHTDANKLFEVLGPLYKLNTVVRPQDFIPGRARDADGKLLGTGGGEWDNRLGIIGLKGKEPIYDECGREKFVVASGAALDLVTGALALDLVTGLKHGISHNQPSSGAAHTVALRQCGSADCKIQEDFSNLECLAYAKSVEDTGAIPWGWATRADANQAQNEAVRICQEKGGSNCSVIEAACNSR